MIALQSFYFFETAIEMVAAKLCCGARYRDGTAPVLLHRATTIDDALIKMRTMGRTKPKRILKWNKTKEINGNVRNLLSANEGFYAVCRNHSARLNEIRIVSNHIAHSSANTRNEFVSVVRRRLGAVPIRLPRPGAFVLQRTSNGNTILEEYVVTLGVIVKDAAKL